MKGINFKHVGKEGDVSNLESFLDKENGFLYLRVNLNSEELPVSKSSGNTMMSKGFLNFTHNDKKIFGNLNLNIGRNKSEIVQENRLLANRIAELEAKLGKK